MENINLNCERFKLTLDKCIQESGLPICVALYVIKDTLNELEKVYYSSINNSFEQDNNEEISTDKEVSDDTPKEEE